MAPRTGCPGKWFETSCGVVRDKDTSFTAPLPTELVYEQAETRHGGRILRNIRARSCAHVNPSCPAFSGFRSRHMSVSPASCLRDIFVAVFTVDNVPHFPYYYHMATRASPFSHVPAPIPMLRAGTRETRGRASPPTARGPSAAMSLQRPPPRRSPRGSARCWGSYTATGEARQSSGSRQAAAATSWLTPRARWPKGSGLLPASQNGTVAACFDKAA